MSRRIEIELTSARPDGSWTWRAAGAREPKGALDGALLPGGALVGTVYRAEAEMELEGITIVSVADPKGRNDKSGRLELIPNAKPFEEVTQQLARRERSDRPSRDRGERGDRPDRPRRDRPAGDRPGGDRPRNDRPGGDRPARDGDGADRRGPRPERRGRPNFTPPPELPQRPKAKRLKPGRAYRSAVLANLPEAQRPVAERALQGGIPAVRQAVNEQNAQLKAAGQEEIPAAGMLAMAEQLLPKLRVAEWLDRAAAAKADVDDLDLRDLRSVVAASDDPMVARDETTRELAAELKQALAAKQDKELRLWFDDIDAAIAVGRVIRALKLSSQPPKAGVPFPTELAKRLADAATASLTGDAASERWAAMLEAAAFSPVRLHVTPSARPEQPSDELTATVKRVARLLPQVAALFGIEPTQGGASPKPLRPTKPAGAAKKSAPLRPPAPPVRPPAPVVAVEPEPAAVEPEPVAVEPEPEPEPVAVEPEPAAVAPSTEPAVEPVSDAAAAAEADQATDV